MTLNSRKGSWYNKYKRDIVLAFIVLVLPFCIYIHLLFDDDGNRYFNLFGSYYYHGFITTRAFAWFILSKVIPLFLCFIWFLTNSKWWRFTILIPCGLYLHSIISFFYNRVFQFEDTLLETSIITILLCTSVILLDEFIANKLIIKGNVSSSYQALKLKSLYKRLKKQFENTQNLRPLIDEQQYGSRLQYLDNLLSEIFFQGSDKTKYLSNENPIRSMSDIFIVVLILIMPVIYNTHHLVPSNVYEIDVLGFKIGSNGFHDFNTFYWFVLSKFCVLLLMIVWFATSKIWWRYAILSPTIIYTYQFLEGFQDIQYLDANSNIKVFPAILTILIVLMLLSYNFKYKFGILDIYEQVEIELEEFIKKSATKELNEFSEFRSLSAKRKEGRSSDEYLDELYRLKQKIQYALGAHP